MTIFGDLIETTEDKKNSSQEIKINENKMPFFGLQMNKFNMLVVFSIVLFLCVSIIQAAPAEVYTTPSEGVQSASSTPRQIKYCTGMAPCGWAVYIPATRRVDFFVKNTCFCASDKVCVRQEDHLSVGAYVYRCVDRPETTTTEKINENAE